ncbi:MAG: hypothetical protein FWD64_07905 [Acidobacteriaceae bacterium]|nr:hypothetical protein [Acidobacteriaceae bacterium]
MERKENGKRELQINVRLSVEDDKLIKKAADILWPDAVLTNSGIVLGLARIAARDTLKSKKPSK